MTRPSAQTAASLFAWIAVAASPVAARLPIPGLPLTLTDAALLVAAALSIPGLGSPRQRRRLVAPLLLLGACALSAVAASDRLAAGKELFQVFLYVILGSAIFGLVDGPRWRRALPWALHAALATGLILALCAYAAPSVFARALPPWPTFAACLSVLALLTTTLRRRPAFLPAATAVLAVALVALAARPAAPVPPSGEPVPQQLREAYAALSVLADRPLLGVGPGNYQTHIGEHYQGMPKDNTMTPGTGVGYGMLAASVGLIGLAAYAEGLRRLLRGVASSRLRAPVLAFAAAGLITPLFVGPMLLLLALLNGLVPLVARPKPVRIPSRRLSLAGCAAGAVLLTLLSVQPVPKDAFTLVWEAEGFAAIQAPMRVQRGLNGASGASAVDLPSGSGQGWRGKGGGSVTYRVDMPRDGQYRLWARALWKDGCTNAFFLTANHGPRFVFGNDAVFGAWHWVKGQRVALKRGVNYIVFANHSDGTALDKLVLTDDPLYVPAGLGDDISRFFDGFAGCDADNTGSWEFPSGRWRVVRAAGEGSGGVNDCLAQWDPKGGLALGGFTAWHDYDAKVRVMLPGTGTIGLIAFRETASTGLRILCKIQEGETVYRLVDEKTGPCAEAREPGTRADRWMELGLRLEGKEVVGLVDGRPLLRAAWRGPRKGQIALFSEGAPGSYFDNASVVFRR